MTRDQAIELLRKHAKEKPESYYAEPFMPHEWAIDAVMAAPLWDFACSAEPCPECENQRKDCPECAGENHESKGPPDFTQLLKEAEAIVRSKPTWKRFIDGTPLSNDVAVWMAKFAADQIEAAK